MLRFNLTIFSVVSVFVLPWWSGLIFVLILIFIFPRYYEAIATALIYDLLYGSTIFGLTIAFLVLIPLVEAIKKRLYVFS